jgi:fructose-bisphosphate aldolase class 1
MKITEEQLKELIDRQQVFQARETAWRAFRGAVEGMPKGWGIDFSSDSRAAYALWMEERDAALLLAPKEE